MRKKCIAIIPARSGSKRIPRKNIKNFCGQSIIAYSIKTALKSNLFDEVMVSTDDEEIAEISKKYGASIPFFRTKIKSDDHAIIADVMYEVLMNYKKRGIFFDYFCCIYSTAPFISSIKIRNALKILKGKMAKTVIPVTKYEYPLQRSLEINRDGKLKMIWPQNYKKRSQDLKPTYHDAGQFFWADTNSFLKDKQVFTRYTYSIEIPSMEAQDIDTLEDWKIAELKYKILNFK